VTSVVIVYDAADAAWDKDRLKEECFVYVECNWCEEEDVDKA